MGFSKISNPLPGSRLPGIFIPPGLKESYEAEATAPVVYVDETPLSTEIEADPWEDNEPLLFQSTSGSSKFVIGFVRSVCSIVIAAVPRKKRKSGTAKAQPV